MKQDTQSLKLMTLLEDSQCDLEASCGSWAQVLLLLLAFRDGETAEIDANGNASDPPLTVFSDGAHIRLRPEYQRRHLDVVVVGKIVGVVAHLM